ncbi:hypothetical protein [Pseudomonas vranovensis]|uniref:hypothetical protein n=1 Tax=Pseudomonas vranovensis TaxID=321661 RepID=UPI000411D1A2|nr:hypothetical protein [Pseudomonas vranovensis]
MSDQPRTPPVHPDEAAFHTARSHMDQRVLTYIENNLNLYFGPLDSESQQRYLQLSKLIGTQQNTLIQLLADCMATFEQDSVKRLQDSLPVHGQERIDPTTWYFHTKILEVPVRSRRDLAATAARERTQSFTLWDAARLDLSHTYPPSYQNSYLEHSYISRHANGAKEHTPVISAETFERVAHRLDLGTALQSRLDTAMNADADRLLSQYHENLFELAGLDAIREPQANGITPQELPAIAGIFNDKAQPWTQCKLTFADASIPLPFFLRRFTAFGTHQSVSYFPNRPGGALRRHFSHDEAVDSIIEQIRANPTEAWFIAALKHSDQITLRNHLKTPAINRSDLNWAAKLLYAAFGDTTTPQHTLAISPYACKDSLRENLTLLEKSTVKSNLASLAVTLGERRFKSLSDHASIVLWQTLELLTLPAPGGVTGLNRVMLAATFGSMAYQTFTAGIALNHGNRTEFIQALGDISDLAISARLQGIGARLSRRRTRQLINSMGNPSIVNLGSHRQALHWPDDDHHEYLSAYDSTDNLTDTLLLQQLLPEHLPTIEPQRAQWLLGLANVERSQLDLLWRSGATPPWQLLEVLQLELTDFKPGFADDPGALTERFPALSPAARDHLFLQHPELRTLGSDSPISSEALNAILQVQMEQRVLQGVFGFSATADFSNPADSEALFCALLISRPGWPTSLGIRVHTGAIDHGGQVTATPTVLAQYALEAPQTFINLYRTSNRYAGSFHTGDLIQIGSGQAGLAKAILRTLNDEQRIAIGFDVYANDALINTLQRQAAGLRSDLVELLPHTNQFPLSASRLSTFRLPMDVGEAQPNSEGIITLDHKYYVLIEDGVYQVLRDKQASSPAQAIWRIVHAQDPVAQAANNEYQASRPGRSEAIALDGQGHWQGILIGGLGGSGRGAGGGRKLMEIKAKNEKIKQELNASADKLDKFVRVMPIIANVTSQPGAKRDTAKQKYHEYIQDLELHKTLLEQHREFLTLLDSPAHFQKSYQLIVGKLILALNHVALIADLDMHDRLDDDNLDPTSGLDIFNALLTPKVCGDYRRSRRIALDSFIEKLPLTHQRDQLLAQLDQQALPRVEYQQINDIDSLYTHYQVRIGMVNLRSQLLSVSDTHDLTAPATLRPQPLHLQHDFTQAALLLIDIAQTPEDKQFALLAHLQERLDAIGEGYKLLKEDHPSNALDSDAAHIDECIKVVDFFRDRSLQQLQVLLQQNEGKQAPSTDLKGIDIEYLPALPSTSSHPHTVRRSKRIIAMQHHDNYRLVLAEQRGADTNTLTLLDVSDGSTPRQVEHTLLNGWREKVIAAERTLAQLGNAATRNLKDIDRLVRQANAQAQGNDAVAANVYEPLLNRVDTLNALIANFDRQATNAPLETQWLEQRQDLVKNSDMLRNLAHELTLKIYKNPEKPNASYLTNLIRLQEVNVRKLNDTRLLIGKGSKRHYMDKYLITDLQAQPLWEAHFHYPEANTPRERFAHGSGHLKSLADARKGIEYQRRQAQQGLEVRSILRVEVSTSLGSSLFSLADQHRH